MYNNSTSWMPVARNIKYFMCGKKSHTPLTDHKHYSIKALKRCRKGRYVFAMLKDKKTIIRVSLKSISASNGERATLPYACSKEDYEKVMNVDRKWKMTNEGTQWF